MLGFTEEPERLEIYLPDYLTHPLTPPTRTTCTRSYLPFPAEKSLLVWAKSRVSSCVFLLTGGPRTRHSGKKAHAIASDVKHI